jgi:predicted DsbA family dithiol-disulfide isomerase
MTPVPVLVLGDFTCPFSYVTEVALWRLADEMPLEPTFRAMELYPAPHPLPFDELGGRVEAALPLARALGVELHTPAVLPRTRKAHEAARFAAEKGAEREMRIAIYRAVFEQGLDVGRIDVLVQLATGLGLDATEARVVLDVDRHAAAVEAETLAAAESGVRGTPMLVVGEGAGARVVSGALPLAELRSILQST